MLDVNYFFTIILSLCLSMLVCLFCPLCFSVVTFDSEDRDKLEGCGGPSCSSKDDGLIRLVCAFSVFLCYSFVIMLLSTEVLFFLWLLQSLISLGKVLQVRIL